MTLSLEGKKNFLISLLADEDEGTSTQNVMEQKDTHSYTCMPMHVCARLVFVIFSIMHLNNDNSMNDDLQSGLCSTSDLDATTTSKANNHRFHQPGSRRIPLLTGGSNSAPTSPRFRLTADKNRNKNKKVSGNDLDDGSEKRPRFPRMEDCAHFHYDCTEIGPLKVELLGTLYIFMYE